MPIPGAFYTISGFPYSQLITVADFNGGTHGGAANEVWFKYVRSGDLAIGALGLTGKSINLYDTDALTLKNSGNAKSLFAQFTAADNTWIRVIKTGGGAISADFTFQADSLPVTATFEPGDYLINDDSPLYGGVVVGRDGDIRCVVPGIPGSEILATLPSGHVLVHDRYGMYGANYLALFDPDLALISAFALSPAVSGFPNIGTSTDNFFVCNQANRNVYKITPAGVVTQVATAIAAGGVNAVGANADETVLYYVANGEYKIRRWDLVGDVALTDFYDLGVTTVGVDLARTGVNGHPGEIVVQTDGSVVTYYQDTSGSNYLSVMLHIDESGTLLHSRTYAISTTTNLGTIIDHISRSPYDPDVIDVWLFSTEGVAHNEDANARLVGVRLSDGTVLSLGLTELFSSQVSLNDPGTQIFGPSTSCGFGTLLGSEVTATVPPEGESAGESSTSSNCCDETSPGTGSPGGGETGSGPPPVGPLPPWTASCTGGGAVDSVMDLDSGEVW